MATTLKLIQQVIINFITNTLPALLISSILFIGGLILLALRIPGWSLLFGLPAITFGFVCLVFTFDDVSRRKIGPQSFKQVNCPVCGKPRLIPYWEEEKICNDCQKKISQKLKTEQD